MNDQSESAIGRREYVDIREIHPAYTQAPCKYDTCSEERWVTHGATQRGFTICPEHGPNIGRDLLPKPEVRI